MKPRMDGNLPVEPWEQCYERLAPKLVLFARQWLPRAQDAEDVVQEAFVRVWKKRKGRDFADAYFFAAVRHASLDFLRGAGRRADRESSQTDGLFEPAESPPAVSPQDVESALASLPPEQREAVVLRIWGGLSFAEIAEITKSPPDTAAARYRYGIAALKKFFDLAAS